MKCVNHPERESIVSCNHCGKPVCSECLVLIKAENYCKECVSQKLGQDRQEEHSPALAALLSFIIGGLGQVYNGQVGKAALIFFTSWLIIPWIIGIFDAYNVAKRIKSGQLSKKGGTGCIIAAIIGAVVFIFMGVFFLAVIAAIAIPNLMLAKVRANEVFAKEAVLSVSAKAEKYRVDKGSYPVGEYIKTERGYMFSQAFKDGKYTITARPQVCGKTGKKIFVVDTGSVLTSRDCVE
ncbi:MAG: hypothetical protein WCY12_04770 [Candidatus Omnitrophota bacterium]|jgi:hypothetical protein